MKPQHSVHGVDTSVAVRIDYDKCIGCQMCTKTCNDVQKIGAFMLAPLKNPPYVHSVSGNNSQNTETTRVKLSDSNCIGCGQCVGICTVGAIQPANRCAEIQVAKQAGLTLIAVLAPSTRIGVAEGMGMPIGSSCEAQMVEGLRSLGFHYVFDNLWGADVCTIEDTKEILKAVQAKKGPVFTSCCPAWINLVETRYPEVIPQISTAKSPTGIICSVIKQKWIQTIGKRSEDVVVVGIMPCTAKKFEANRHQLTVNGVKDCDISITSREMVELFKENNMQFSEEREQALKQENKGKFDAPFNEYSGSAYIFGKSAGVTESVARYVYALNKIEFNKSLIQQSLLWESKDKSQNIKIQEFSVNSQKYRACIAHGGASVEELMKIWQAGRLKGVDVVEVMMCPGGCINGGGQPKPGKRDTAQERVKGLNKHDMESNYKDAEHNQKMHEMMKQWAPTEAEEHELLHTHYENRKMK